MQNKKSPWRMIIAALAIFTILPATFFLITVYFSKPVEYPVVYGQVEKAVAGDFDNCLILYPEKPLFITAGKTNSLSSQEIRSSLEKQIESVQNDAFNIIITQETTPELTDIALKACTSAGLKNYRILSL